MNKLKKSLALVATLAIASTGLVACGGDSKDGGSTTTKATTAAATTAAGSDAAGTTTAAAGTDAAATTAAPAAAGENKFEEKDDSKCRILAWNANDVGPMIECIEENKPELKGKFEYYNVGKNGGEAHEQYATYFKGGEDCDLFQLEADWILDYIDDDTVTAPITDLGFAATDFDGGYGYVKAIGKNKDGKIKGASWQATPGAYVYNTELAEKFLGVKTPEEMQAKVKDWDTFKATAKELAEKSSGKTALVDTLGGLWQVKQYTRDKGWVVDGKLVIDDYYKNYADMAKEFWDNGWVTQEDQWQDGWYAIGQTDGSSTGTLGYFFCTWCLGKGSMLSNAEGGEGGKTFGKYNIVSGPADWAWGGSWMGLSPKCNNGKSAYEFIKFFCVDEATMEKYALKQGEFVNNPKVMKKIVADKTNKNDLLGGADQFAILVDKADKIDMEGKISKYDSNIKNAFNDEIKKYVKGETKSYDEMIDAFKKSVAKTVPDLTIE